MRADEEDLGGSTGVVRDEAQKFGPCVELRAVVVTQSLRDSGGASDGVAHSDDLERRFRREEPLEAVPVPNRLEEATDDLSGPLC